MKWYSTKKIKVFLVFFCCQACSESGQISGVDLVYTENKAVAVTFMADGKSADGFHVALKSSKTPMLGKFIVMGGKYTFTPIVAFTDGQTYEIRVRGKALTDFQVRSRETGEVPELVHIYPTTDAVPENLLKMHFHFSLPMQEAGRALDFINVTENSSGDTKEVFLDMEAELWNNTHDRLTLWLDPGRIKTNLIPNKEKGLPLIKEKSYTIRLDRNWKAANGIPLGRAYGKKLKVIDRDDERPKIDDWQLHLPEKNSREALRIGFNEILDAPLAEEALTIHNAAGEAVNGAYTLMENERILEFIPETPWTSGAYEVRVQACLEDLAGNNLNRLFDTKVSAADGSLDTAVVNGHKLDFFIR